MAWKSLCVPPGQRRLQEGTARERAREPGRRAHGGVEEAWPRPHGEGEALGKGKPSGLRDARPHAEDLAGQIGREAMAQLDALCRRGLLEQGDCLPQQLAQVEAEPLGLEPARLELGIIEHIVDQLEQGPAALGRELGEAALLGVELRVQQ